MENHAVKLEFENLISENLTYAVISKMTFDEYKKFIVLLFSKINQWRNEGLTRDDIDSFIKQHYSKITSTDVDTDVLFERRFSAVTEELQEFCADPHFWNTNFEVYM